ncbi:ATP-binding protein [Aquimarina sp. W85]|uniref:GAF domain-containing sensor histidine kinase n=1 Tax=Aquimarina rhodophyticola TaxID=3342246 RepID=UPI00366D005C
MITNSTTPYESRRLQALHSYQILNTPRETIYDEITKITSKMTGKPIALISFVDKDYTWYKASTGYDQEQDERAYSFCSHAILEEQKYLIVENALIDTRFSKFPSVNNSHSVRFYAGVCLIDEQGFPLGTLCIFDSKPSHISEEHLEFLKVTSRQIIKILTLTKLNKQLSWNQSQVEKRNALLRDFAGIVSHDIKMPLSNIILTTEVLRNKYFNKLDFKALEYLSYLKESAFRLSDYINDLLSHYESEHDTQDKLEKFDLNELLSEIVDLLSISDDVTIHFPETSMDLYVNRAALEQIFLNLIGNCLKYNDKDLIEIDIKVGDGDSYYYFSITDNGIGISEEKQSKIFDLFKTAVDKDRSGNTGNGIGLNTVKNLVENLGGTITLSSKIGKGTSFHFSLKKHM